VDTKLAIAIVAALVVGAAGGGIATAKFYPASAESQSGTTETVGSGDAALEDALKEAAEARTEAAHWRGQFERLEKEVTSGPDEAKQTAAATEPVGDMVNVGQSDSPVMDAAMLKELQEYRARDRERQERESERDERNAERREDWAEWQTEMLNRRTDMFTDLINRTDDPAEQQRWADIERNMTVGRDLMRDMRDADTDEERAAVRDALRQNYESTQSLLKKQQDAVLERALEAEGIENADEVAQIQRAVRSSLGDEAFRMSGSGGGRGWGGPRGGFGGRGPR
jgi:hypothetical protein